MSRFLCQFGWWILQILEKISFRTAGGLVISLLMGEWENKGNIRKFEKASLILLCMRLCSGPAAL